MSFKLSLARFQKPASPGMDVQFTMPWSSPVSMSASHFGQVAMAGDPPDYEYGSYCKCSRQEAAHNVSGAQASAYGSFVGNKRRDLEPAEPEFGNCT